MLNPDISYSTTDRTERYKITLLDMWENVRVLEVKVLSYYLSVVTILERGSKPEAIPMSDDERHNMNELLALSITLWRELYPKVKGKGEIETKFKTFDQENRDPKSYIDNMDRLFSLTDTLREALEILEVTKFEKEMR